MHTHQIVAGHSGPELATTVQIIGGSWRTVPRFVKIVLLLQAVIIIGLSVWMCKECASNAYVQTYLLSLFQGNGSIIAVLGLWRSPRNRPSRNSS
jgi:hypothetical protein